MSTTTDLWEDGQRRGLGAFTLIGEGFKLIGAHLVPVIVIFVLMSAAAYGSIWATGQYGLMTAGATDPMYLGVTFAASLVGAVLSGALLRSLLARPLSIDRGFLTYVAIITVVSFVVTAGAKLIGPTPPEPGDTAAAMAQLWKVPVMLIAFLVYAFVAVKLMLWPIGVLVGDADVTPGKSWNLTQRAFWGYILGTVLLCLVPFCIVGFLGMQAGQAAQATGAVAAPSPLSAPLGALMGLFGTALAAAVYKLRREEPEV